MTAIYDITDLAETNASTWTGPLTRLWSAFEASRQRRRLRSALYSLSDRELFDIGTNPGEIEHIVLNYRPGRANLLRADS
jgi:uncharacterized protein YjiS (DUF1127 family)